MTYVDLSDYSNNNKLGKTTPGAAKQQNQGIRNHTQTPKQSQPRPKERFLKALQRPPKKVFGGSAAPIESLGALGRDVGTLQNQLSHLCYLETSFGSY
jgi:hypothetical protein